MFTVQKMEQDQQAWNERIGAKFNHKLHQRSIITKEEAEEYLKENRRVNVATILSNDRKRDPIGYFFIDDYCCCVHGGYTHTVVTASFTLPSRAAARPGLEDGIVDTVDKLIFLYFKDDGKYISTIEELVEFLNQQGYSPQYKENKPQVDEHDELCELRMDKELSFE